MPPMPRISPPATLKLMLLEIGAELLVGAQGKVVQSQPGLGAGRGPAAVGRRLELAADHEFRQALGAFLAGVAFGHDPAEAHDGRPLAERLDLLQLVADVEDGAAFLSEPAQGFEKLAHFLGRQHGGRFVHDQQTRLLQQAAHDLDALALADGKIVHRAVRIEGEPVGGRDFDDAPAQAPALSRVVDGESDVLRHGQRLEQGKMLEHHADAQTPGGVRARDPDRLALPPDFAGIGLQHAIDDLHQRALAGAVLAQKRMDLARQDSEIYAVIGEAAGESFRDAGQGKERRRADALQFPLRHDSHPPIQ